MLDGAGLGAAPAPTAPLAPSGGPVPDPFVVMYGHYDGPGVTNEFRKIIGPFSVIEGTSADATFIKELRSQNRVYAAHVTNPQNETAAQLVARWRAPFQNTLGGQLPGGYDAIAIDELHAADTNGTAHSNAVVSALQQLRNLYPNKGIYVAVTWQYGNLAASYSDQWLAMNNHADMIMLENYLRETNQSYGFFPQWADKLKAVSPNLLSKTVYGLGISQQGHVFDDTTDVGYWGHLDQQFHTIRNDADARTMPGVMFWAYYRSETDVTPDYAARLVDHYYVQNNTTFLGDGSRSQLISNPKFDGGTAGWSLNAGAGGTVGRFSYSSVAFDNDHGNFGWSSHGTHGLRMVRGSAANEASYQVGGLDPNKVYTVSAWVYADSPGRRAKMKLTDQNGTLINAEQVSNAGTGTQWNEWSRIIFNFQPTSNTIKVVLTDDVATAGTTLYWDFIELEDAYPAGPGANRAPSRPGALGVQSVQGDRATVTWGASSDPDGDALTYSVQHRKSDLSTSWSPIERTSGTQLTITGLEDNSSYNVRVRATDGELASAWRSAQSLVTTTDFNNLPTRPGALSVTSVGLDRATISWGASTDADGDPITYRVQYRKDDLSEGWSPKLVAPGTTTTLTDLAPNTSYRVRVRAHDGTEVSTWQKVNDFFTTSAANAWPYVEDFADGQAQDFTAQSGTWSVSSGAYEVQTSSQDTLSILSLPAPLSEQYVVEAPLTVTSGGKWHNAFIAFDVVDDTNYKLAQAMVGRAQWRLGQRAPGGFQFFAGQAASVDLDRSYTARLSIEGSVATLIVDGTTLVSHDYGESLSDGAIALGTQRSHARYDHVIVSPRSQLNYSENFNDDTADDFIPIAGRWQAQNGRYELSNPDSDAVSVLTIPTPLPPEFDLSVSLNVQAGGQWKNASVIFDFADPTHYKLITAAPGADRWRIGQRSGTNWQWLQTVQHPMVLDADYGVRLEIRGAAVELFVDEQSVASHDFAEALNDGQVGLGSRRSDARFDDLAIAGSNPTFYGENFDDGAADGLAPLAGSWSIVGGAYGVQTQNEDTFSVLSFPASLPIDFDLALKVRVQAGGDWKNADVIFDFVDATHYKLVSASAGSNRWRIGLRDGANVQWLQTVSQPVALDTDYDLRIEVRGAAATLIVDGATLLSRQFADPLVDGALALGSRRSHARFDDLVVSSPNPAPLAALLASFGTYTGPGASHLSDFDQDGDVDDADLSWLLSNGV